MAVRYFVTVLALPKPFATIPLVGEAEVERLDFDAAGGKVRYWKGLWAGGLDLQDVGRSVLAVSNPGRLRVFDGIRLVAEG